MDSSLKLLAAGLSAATERNIEFTDNGGADVIALHKLTTRGRVRREDIRSAFETIGTFAFRTSPEPSSSRGFPSSVQSGLSIESLDDYGYFGRFRQDEIAGHPMRPSTHLQTRGPRCASSTGIGLCPGVVARLRLMARRRCGSPSRPSPRFESEFPIFIKPERGSGSQVSVATDTTIAEVRGKIQSITGRQSSDYYLWHRQRLLEDDNTVDSYGIKKGDKIDLVPKRHARENVFAVSKDVFAPRFDYDFTNAITPLWNSYERGDEVYRRPYGWKRYGLQVLGEFEDDDWLGGRGPRKKSSSGEWPVSYHGTSKSNAESITERGYLVSKGHRFKYGEGIYSTPDLRIAEQYATEFEHEGKKYMIALQNRVNPINLKRIANADKVGTGEYWLNPEQSDVRPYGILIKEKKYSWRSVCWT